MACVQKESVTPKSMLIVSEEYENNLQAARARAQEWQHSPSAVGFRHGRVAPVLPCWMFFTY